jgi:hypothetical protein
MTSPEITPQSQWKRKDPGHWMHTVVVRELSPTGRSVTVETVGPAWSKSTIHRYGRRQFLELFAPVMKP